MYIRLHSHRETGVKSTSPGMAIDSDPDVGTKQVLQTDKVFTLVIRQDEYPAARRRSPIFKTFQSDVLESIGVGGIF